MRGTGRTGGVGRSAWRVLAMVGTAVPLLAIAGCGRGADDTVAVRTASERLIAASGNGAAGTGAKERSDAYAAVISEMQGLERSASNEGVKAAATLLTARAMIGQGELAAEQCRDQRIVALMEIARLRSLLMLREDTSSLSGALSVYDPTADLAAIDTVSREVASEADAIRNRLKDLESQIAEVRGQIGERLERSRELREQDSTIRLSTANLGAGERAEAVSNATTIRREADALEKSASELELNATALETLHTELEGVAASLEERSKLLASARARVQESASLMSDEAKGSAENAAKFRAELADGFAALRAGALTDMLASYDEAIRTFGTAASKAGGARSADAINASLTAASAYQSAADLHRQIAQTLTLAAALAEGVGAADAAAELNAKRDEVNLAAGEALGSAAGAFGGVRAGRDQATNDAIQKLVESLEREGRRLRGEPEPEPEPDPSAEPGVEEQVTTDAEGEPTTEPAPEDQPAPDAPAEDPSAEPSEDPDAQPADAPAEEPAPEDPSSDPEPAPEPAPE